jgi:hypothetical protein
MKRSREYHSVQHSDGDDSQGKAPEGGAAVGASREHYQEEEMLPVLPKRRVAAIKRNEDLILVISHIRGPGQCRQRIAHGLNKRGDHCRSWWKLVCGSGSPRPRLRPEGPR